MADITTTPLMPMLEHYLSLTAASQQRTTSNIANADTPGYRTRDIDFQGEMRRAAVPVPLSANFENSSLENSGFDDAGFNDAGFSDAVQDNSGFAPRLTPVVRQVAGLIERPDGNNVSLDREGMMLSQTQLQYQLGEQLIKHEFHQLLAAIGGGS